MATKLLLLLGMMFGGFYFVGNVLRIIESISQGQSFVGAAVAAVIAGLMAGGCILALSLEAQTHNRDPFGRAQFERDRKAAEEAGLK